MATGKAQKKDKLRHAEYYDFQEFKISCMPTAIKAKFSNIWLKSLHCPKIYGWHTATSRKTMGA